MKYLKGFRLKTDIICSNPFLHSNFIANFDPKIIPNSNEEEISKNVIKKASLLECFDMNEARIEDFVENWD